MTPNRVTDQERPDRCSEDAVVAVRVESPFELAMLLNGGVNSEPSRPERCRERLANHSTVFQPHMV